MMMMMDDDSRVSTVACIMMIYVHEHDSIHVSIFLNTMVFSTFWLRKRG